MSLGWYRRIAGAGLYVAGFGAALTILFELSTPPFSRPILWFAAGTLTWLPVVTVAVWSLLQALPRGREPIAFGRLTSDAWFLTLVLSELAAAGWSRVHRLLAPGQPVYDRWHLAVLLVVVAAICARATQMTHRNSAQPDTVRPS